MPEEQRYDHRLLQSVRGTPWEPNAGDVSTDLPEPLLIIRQLPDVEPAPTETYHSDNRETRNIYIRKIDLERFGNTAGCPACEAHRAGSPMSGQEHTAKCIYDPVVANPNSSSGSGQHIRVRFADQERRDPKPERDTEMRAGSQETPEARTTRLAETDAERVEEEATSAEVSERRLALKRKAENELYDSGNPEVEDSVMISLTNVRHRDNDPDDEVDLPILKQRDCNVASVHETGSNKPVCQEPKTAFPSAECGWDYFDDTRGKLLNNTLVENRRDFCHPRTKCLGCGRQTPRRGCVWHKVGRHQQRRRDKTVLPQSSGRARVQASSRLVILHSHSAARGTA